MAVKSPAHKVAHNVVEDCFVNRRICQKFGFVGIDETLEEAYRHLHAKNKSLIPTLNLFNRTMLAIIAQDRGLDVSMYGADAQEMLDSVADIGSSC